MPYVRIDYDDGHYSMQQVSSSGPTKGLTYIAEAIWQAYDAHLNQSAVWYYLLQKLSNEQYEKDHDHD